MDKKEIERKVKDVLADKLDTDVKKINLTSDIVNDLGMDSFMAIELAFELQEKLGIEISVKDFQGIRTVKDIINFICSKTK